MTRRPAAEPAPADPTAALTTALALRSLATRVLRRRTSTGATGPGETVLSTLEMVDRGVRTQRGHLDLGVRLAPGLDLPEAVLPLDPYALGHDHVLRDRIPAPYLRASADQRLALLQGLMDSSGCLDVDGAYELRLLGPGPAGDAAELVRSLGAAATVSGDIRSAATHHVTFVSDLPVFGRARALDRVLDQAPPRDAPAWVHVTGIERVRPGATGHEPVCGVGVDSPDATHLVAGMLATHGTVFPRATSRSAPATRAA